MLREFTTGVALTILCTSLSAQLSGAIFTTEAGGQTVDGNIYEDCCDVYLNGGPPEHAPCTAAGLPDGHYYFQVTDPSGSVLLSVDAISEREVVVQGGLITQYVGGPTGSVSPCVHVVSVGKCAGLGGIGIQLMPFDQTPNPGGEYKAWMTPIADYVVASAGTYGGGTYWGFRESRSKTDNFKCRDSAGQGPLDISCPMPFTVCNDAGSCDAVVTYVDPIIIGGFEPYNVSCTPASGDIFPIGITHVTCTVTDAIMQQAQCGFDITVEDCEAPQIQCASITAACSDPGECGAVVDYGVTATDNCPGVTVTCTPAAGTLLSIGTHPVSCTATDAAGLTSQCNFDVTIDDCEDPVLDCPDVQASSDPGLCSATVTYPIPQATDNCGISDVTCTPVPGSIFPVGYTQVSCTATDTSGNQSHCNFNVHVDDDEDPVINCPGDIVTGTDPGVCGANVNFAATASDNCGATVSCTPESGSLFGTGVTQVNCTATDTAGNTDECAFDVTVDDDEAPVITCPASIVADNDAGLCGASVPFSAPTATDNCDVDSISCTPASGDSFPVGTTQVSCTATDAAGNVSDECVFDVTVNDTEDPTISCPADVVASNDAGVCGADVTYAAPSTADNCGVASVSCSPASGSAFPTGDTVVSCTVEDIHGNQAQCDFLVTVNDDEDPAISCPADINVCNDQGLCGAAVTFAPTSSDNCGITSESCSPASGSVFPVGITQVCCTAEDAAGNSAQCCFNVTVADCEAPVISCAGDIVQCNDPGNCDAVVNYALPPATDNCDGGTTVTCSPASGSVFPLGVTTVSCTSSDTTGNVGACDFDVTVNDCEAPTISCPADIDVCLETVYGTEVSWADPAASDNCPGVSVSCTPASGSLFALGLTPVNCTATDAAGNTAHCGFNVTVAGATACASKFFDANGNAIDDDGTPLAGWQMVLSGTDSAGNPFGPVVDVTGGGGTVCFGDIPLGNYTLTESASVVGTWVSTTGTSCNFTIDDCGDSPQCSFGNLCGEPLTGGHTIGFWRNRNGKNVLAANDPAWRDELNALCLVDENGDSFTIPAGGFSSAFNAWKSWLQGAQATNMAYMLSAQLAGTTLSSLYNGLDPASSVYIGQDLGGCWGGTITTVQGVLDAGAALLCGDAYTPSGDPNRDAQECVKDILDGLNNNDFIAPSATPCAFGF